MASVIRPGDEPRAPLSLPRFKTVVGALIVGVGLWLCYVIVRELIGVVGDPNASAWLATFRDLPAEARTITTPDGEYSFPPVVLQVIGLGLLAVFLYCLTSLAAVILRIGGWMMRDDAEEVLSKLGKRIDSIPSVRASSSSGSVTAVRSPMREPNDESPATEAIIRQSRPTG